MKYKIEKYVAKYQQHKNIKYLKKLSFYINNHTGGGEKEVDATTAAAAEVKNMTTSHPTLERIATVKKIFNMTIKNIDDILKYIDVGDVWRDTILCYGHEYFEKAAQNNAADFIRVYYNKNIKDVKAHCNMVKMSPEFSITLKTVMEKVWNKTYPGNFPEENELLSTHEQWAKQSTGLGNMGWIDNKVTNDKMLKPGVIPLGITTLILSGTVGNTELTPGILPNTLKTLHLKNFTNNNKPLTSGSFPESLEKIHLGSFTNGGQELTAGMLPNSLRYIYMNDFKNAGQELKAGVLPNSLYLVSMCNFTNGGQDLKAGVLPNKLLHLHMNNFNNNNVLLNQNVIPNTLRSIRYMAGAHTLNKSQLEQLLPNVNITDDYDDSLCNEI
jgi:FNIP Repeat